MHVEEAIRSRRAVKRYDTTFVLSQEEKDELFKLAMLAPSAYNLQPVRFVEISDPALRAEVSKASGGQFQMTEASMLVLVCARLDAWEQCVPRILEGAPPPALERMPALIDGYYRDRPQVQRDEAMRSCGLAAQTLMLAARGKGLESCPMVGFDFEAVGKLVNLPENHVIGLMVAIGRQAAAPLPRFGKLRLDEAVVRNRF